MAQLVGKHSQCARSLTIDVQWAGAGGDTGGGKLAGQVTIGTEGPYPYRTEGPFRIYLVDRQLRADWPSGTVLTFA